jgi:hypothetical protein
MTVNCCASISGDSQKRRLLPLAAYRGSVESQFTKAARQAKKALTRVKRLSECETAVGFGSCLYCSGWTELIRNDGRNS